jgi:hypothetical protein
MKGPFQSLLPGLFYWDHFSYFSHLSRATQSDFREIAHRESQLRNQVSIGQPQAAQYHVMLDANKDGTLTQPELQTQLTHMNQVITQSSQNGSSVNSAYVEASLFGQQLLSNFTPIANLTGGTGITLQTLHQLGNLTGSSGIDGGDMFRLNNADGYAYFQQQQQALYADLAAYGVNVSA